MQRAAIDGRGAVVGVHAGEGQRAVPGLGQAESAAADRAADGQGVGVDPDCPARVHRHRAGAEIQAVGADEGEVAVPVLDVVVGGVGEIRHGAVERTAVDRQRAGAKGGGKSGGAAKRQGAGIQEGAAVVGIRAGERQVAGAGLDERRARAAGDGGGDDDRTNSRKGIGRMDDELVGGADDNAAGPGDGERANSGIHNAVERERVAVGVDRVARIGRVADGVGRAVGGEDRRAGGGEFVVGRRRRKEIGIGGRRDRQSAERKLAAGRGAGLRGSGVGGVSRAGAGLPKGPRAQDVVDVGIPGRVADPANGADPRSLRIERDGAAQTRAPGDCADREIVIRGAAADIQVDRVRASVHRQAVERLLQKPVVVARILRVSSSRKRQGVGGVDEIRRVEAGAAAGD